MFRRLTAALSLLAAVTCGLSGQGPAAGPQTPASRQQATQPPKQATLAVQDVTLSKPMEVVVEGRKQSVRNVTEFRVTAAEPMPIRALDPVLVVGGMRITDYRYENRDRTLVFTLYEPQKLSTEAALDAYLQYGDDETSRTPLPTLKRSEIRKIRR